MGSMKDKSALVHEITATQPLLDNSYVTLPSHGGLNVKQEAL